MNGVEVAAVVVFGIGLVVLAVLLVLWACREDEY